jgi:hypothetical protein
VVSSVNLEVIPINFTLYELKWALCYQVVVFALHATSNFPESIHGCSTWNIP